MTYTKKYENLMVLTLSLIFGFVMFDRFALSNLSAYILPDLSMDVVQLGVLTSAFAISWSVAGYLGAAISDISRNKKRVLMICVILFSVFSLSTGLAGGFTSLIAIRFIMGIFEGPILPIAQTIIINESSVNRRGLNGGIMQVVAPGLISTLAGPLICVWLCENFGWRATFYLTIVPGLIIAFMIFRLIKEPQIAASNASKPTFKESLGVLKNRNVLISIIAGVFVLYWYICVLAFGPVAIGAKGIDPQHMAVIMSCFGVGAIIWGIIVPKIGDTIGRKPTIFIFCLISCVAPFGIVFFDSYIAMGACAVIGWCGAGVFPLFEAVVPGESVDPRYSASAIGLVQLVGELVGAGAGATLCGWIGNTYGMNTAMITMGIAIIIAAVISLGYYETCPAVLAKRKAAKEVAAQ